jgi:superfamily II DNA/RNA helicase
VTFAELVIPPELVAALAKQQVTVPTGIQTAAIPILLAGLAPSLKLVQVGEEPVNENIEHFCLVCEERDKPDMLRKLLHALNPERAIVFVQKSGTTEEIAARLAHHKVPAAALHAEGDKFSRKRAMDDFRAGRVPVMVASDVAAR